MNERLTDNRQKVLPKSTGKVKKSLKENYISQLTIKYPLVLTGKHFGTTVDITILYLRRGHKWRHVQLLGKGHIGRDLLVVTRRMFKSLKG